MPSKTKPPAKGAKKEEKPKAKETKKDVKPKKTEAKGKVAKESKSKKADSKKDKPAAKEPKKEEVKKAKKPKKRNSEFNKLFVPRQRIPGKNAPPIRDLTRYVRWPKYIRRQRQKSILMRRLKVPPAINQFRFALDRVTQSHLFRLVRKYRPLTKKERYARLKKFAKAKIAHPHLPEPPKREQVHMGFHLVTRLIEKKCASLVMIAHDVDPVEIVVWMPALCRKMEVPYVICHSKSALGRLVGKKKVTCLAMTQIRSQDKSKFQKILDSIKIRYTDKYEEDRKRWGGLHYGVKHTRKMHRRSVAAAAAKGLTFEPVSKKKEKSAPPTDV